MKNILSQVKDFTNVELKQVETVVKHNVFVPDTDPDNELAKVIDHLYISSGDGAANLDELTAHNITHIINLAPSAAKNHFTKKFEYLTIQALDLPAYVLIDSFDICIDFIDKCLNSETEPKGCLVHCNAGISRSSTIIIAYLIKTRNITIDEALAIVRVNRPQAQPNTGFRRQLEEFVKALDEKNKTS